MKKFLIIAAIVIVMGIGSFFYLKWNNNEERVAPQASTPSSDSTNANPPVTPASSATYKDGSYTGDTVQTDRGYGPVQVKAVISGGKITDIVFLQMPSGFGHSQEVTSFAEPILKQEVITAQSSQIDIVSGATQDTQAFQQSLTSALAQAK